MIIICRKEVNYKPVSLRNKKIYLKHNNTNMKLNPALCSKYYVHQVILIWSHTDTYKLKNKSQTQLANWVVLITKPGLNK